MKKTNIAYLAINTALIATCVLTLPEMVKVINGTCLFGGLELWSYRIGLASWFGLGIQIFRNSNGRKTKK